MKNLGNAVAEEPGGKPGAPMDVSNGTGRLTSGEEQQEKPHDLNRPDRQCAEVIDVGGACDAKSHGTSGL